MRRVGEWFLAVRAKANTWIVTLGVMVVCRAVLCYILYCTSCLCTRRELRDRDS